MHVSKFVYNEITIFSLGNINSKRFLHTAMLCKESQRRENELIIKISEYESTMRANEIEMNRLEK